MEPPQGPLPAAVLAEITAAVIGAGNDARRAEERLTHLADGVKIDPRVVAGDVDGDGKPDMAVTFGWCFAPVILYRAGATQDPVVAPLPRGETRLGGPGRSRVDRIADVNDDGRPELVVAYTRPGASAGHTDLVIYQWQPGGLQILFHDHLTDWVGPNEWQVGAGTVAVQCYAFGPYSYKMTSHRHQTETYRWNRSSGRYELLSRTLTAPETQLQQVSVAEQLFQQGNYEGAARAFRKVGPHLKAREDGQEPDWIAYSHLRLGQIDALAGRKAAAVTELKQAEQGREPVPSLAAAFRKAYQEQDAAAGFTALWRLAARRAYSARGSLREDWPFNLDPHTLGARRAMLDAYKHAGREAPHPLPEERAFPEPDCLAQDWG
jgi:hypothetical protein